MHDSDDDYNHLHQNIKQQSFDTPKGLSRQVSQAASRNETPERQRPTDSDTPVGAKRRLGGAPPLEQDAKNEIDKFFSINEQHISKGNITIEKIPEEEGFEYKVTVNGNVIYCNEAGKKIFEQLSVK